MWIDRLEATVEAHILPAAHVRERCTIRAFGANRLSLPRQGGDERGAPSRRACPCAPQPAYRARRRRGTSPSGRFPGNHQAARRRWRLGHVPCREPGRARGRRAGTCPLDGAQRGDRGVHRGARGLLRYARHRRPHRARLHQPLLPERARSDARPLDLAPDHRHEPDGRARLWGGQGNGPAGDRARSASAPRQRTWNGSSGRRA